MIINITKMDTKILWNSISIRGKREGVSNKISHYDIAIITETKMKKTNNLQFRGYNTVNICRDNNGITAGDVSIAIRNNIKYEEVKVRGNNPGVIECAGIRTKLVNKAVTIIGIYKRPNTDTGNNIWKKLIRDNRGNNNRDVIIAGDFNCHNRKWNCEITDTSGERLADEMEKEDMYLVNNNSMSRIGEGQGRDANIDLMFVSSNLFNKFSYFQVDDSWGSDHFSTVFAVNARIETYVKKSKRCSTKNTDWKEYTRVVENKCTELQGEKFQNADTEEKYNIIKDIMIESVNIATERKNTKKFTSLDITVSPDQQGQTNIGRRGEKYQDKEW